MADVTPDDLARIITATHLSLVRDDVTVSDLRAAGLAAAEAIVGLVDGSQAETLPADHPGILWAPGIVVALASDFEDDPDTGTVVGSKSDMGETHTVMVRWDDDQVTSHHPTELRVRP